MYKMQRRRKLRKLLQFDLLGFEAICSCIGDAGGNDVLIVNGDAIPAFGEAGLLHFMLHRKKPQRKGMVRAVPRCGALGSLLILQVADDNSDRHSNHGEHKKACGIDFNTACHTDSANHEEKCNE